MVQYFVGQKLRAKAGRKYGTDAYPEGEIFWVTDVSSLGLMVGSEKYIGKSGVHIYQSPQDLNLYFPKREILEFFSVVDSFSANERQLPLFGWADEQAEKT